MLAANRGTTVGAPGVGAVQGPRLTSRRSRWPGRPTGLPFQGMLDRSLEEAKNHVLELERDLAACLLHAEHMDQALATRDVIGQAKGIIMSATGKDADAAFADLVAMSQHLNESCASSRNG